MNRKIGCWCFTAGSTDTSLGFHIFRSFNIYMSMCLHLCVSKCTYYIHIISTFCRSHSCIFFAICSWVQTYLFNASMFLNNLYLCITPCYMFDLTLKRSRLVTTTKAHQNKDPKTETSESECRCDWNCTIRLDWRKPRWLGEVLWQEAMGWFWGIGDAEGSLTFLQSRLERIMELL